MIYEPTETTRTGLHPSQLKRLRTVSCSMSAKAFDAKSTSFAANSQETTDNCFYGVELVSLSGMPSWSHNPNALVASCARFLGTPFELE